MEKDWNDKIIAIPTDKWHSSIVGRALTPGQVAGVIVGTPLAAAGSAVVTAASLAAFRNAMAAVEATTLGALAGTTAVLNNVLTEVSDNLFVDW